MGTCMYHVLLLYGEEGRAGKARSTCRETEHAIEFLKLWSARRQGCAGLVRQIQEYVCET